MNVEAINRVKQYFNLYCKEDFRASVNRRKIDDITFNFFSPSITCINQERTDEYCLAALVLGYKDCMCVYRYDINEIIKKYPDLNQLLKDRNLYYYYIVKGGIPVYYIYTENGKRKLEILTNAVLEDDYVYYIIVGKCFDYNDEDIEYFCIRNDFTTYCFRKGMDYGMDVVEDNLTLFRTYEKWWNIHNKPKYVADYNTAVKYINNFNESWTHHDKFQV